MAESDFIFEEHILRTDYSQLINELKNKLNKKFRIFQKTKSLENKIKKLEDLQEKTDKDYSFYKWFLDETCKNRNCKVTYNSEINRVTIKGQGQEIFNINGDPVFSISYDKKIKETTLPVIIGHRKAELKLYDYPQTELKPGNDLVVYYNFDSSFSIGNPFANFTNDLMDYRRHYPHQYRGSPGKVYLIEGDRIYNDLFHLVHQECTISELCLSVQLYLGEKNKFFYQGNMDCINTTFPYFIIKDNDHHKNRKHIMKHPATTT